MDSGCWRRRRCGASAEAAPVYHDVTLVCPAVAGGAVDADAERAVGLARDEDEGADAHVDAVPCEAAARGRHDVLVAPSNDEAV